jgi:hypothetical protein
MAKSPIDKSGGEQPEDLQERRLIADDAPEAPSREARLTSRYGPVVMRGLNRMWKRLQVRGRRFRESTGGKRVLTAARYALSIVIGGYLVYQLSTIGWHAIWDALPRTPWFYILFAGTYLTLPIFQSVIFSLIFGLSPVRLFPAMLKKRVYDKDVMSYSGNVYLYAWIRKRTEADGSSVIHAVKDNEIISAVVSTLIAATLLTVFLLAGLMKLPEYIQNRELTYALAIVIVGGIGLSLTVRFRKVIIKLPGQIVPAIFGLHALRLLLVQALQVLEWEVVQPAVGLDVWFTFLALQIITGRIPLLPSRDLIYVSLSVEVAGAVQVSQAAIAGLMLVHSMLDKAVNVLLFIAVSVWDQVSTVAVPATVQQPGEESSA